jgi:hypothetical protein
LITDGIEGLIWTDMIMGNKIEHLPTAVQKAGRGAGIIRQCPQYSGEFHYWIEKENAKQIKRHYEKVDVVNELPGSNSLLQAITHAEAVIPNIRHNHSVDLNTFRVIKADSPENTLKITKEIVTRIFRQFYRTPQRGTEQTASENFYVTSLNATQEVAKLIDTIKKVPGAYGTNGGQKKFRRFLPCYKDITDEETLHCVIPLIDPMYDENNSAMKRKLDEEYSQYFVTIPQDGEF